MPAKKGRPIALTKRIDGYLEEVPRAWDSYLEKTAKGMKKEKAERAAMRSVYPVDNNTGVRLKTWKKHKFWAEDATHEIEQTRQHCELLLSQGTAPDTAEIEAVKTVLRDYPHPVETLEIWKQCGVWSLDLGGATEDHREDPRDDEESLGWTEKESRFDQAGTTQESPRQTKDIPRSSQTDQSTRREEIMAQLRAFLAEIPLEERKWYGKATGKAPEADKFLQLGAKLPPEVVREIKGLSGRYAHHLERALKLYLLVLKSAED